MFSFTDSYGQFGSNFESDFGASQFELCPWNAGSSNPTYTSYMELNWHWHMCN